MHDTLLEATIATSPDKVFKALTEQQELGAWWTTDMIAEPKVGSTLQATFHDMRPHGRGVGCDLHHQNHDGNGDDAVDDGTPE